MTRIGFRAATPPGPRKVLWKICAATTVAFSLGVLLLYNESGKYEVEAVTLPEAMRAVDDRRHYDAVVNVMRDGTYRLMGRTYTERDLKDFLVRRRIAIKGRNALVKIRCDADAPYKYVQSVMDGCRDAGIYEVSFGVAQKHGTAPG